MSTVCKRCLLSEIDQRDVYESVQRAVNSIPSSLKTAPAEYERRLKLCGTCDSLLSGTCMCCGCYVELRAALRTAHCPDKANYW